MDCLMNYSTLIGLTLLILLAAGGRPPAAASSSGPDAVRILVLGDSLAAGYGIAAAEAFPEQLQKELLAAGYRVKVVNAGVSGETSAGGLSRLEWALAEQPDIVILELGGNDALRGLAPEQTRANLDRMVARLTGAGVDVLLAGMRAPRNLGSDYYSKFDTLYPELAEKHGIALYPFFLEGVAGESRLNLGDGIHPNSRGVRVIVEKILPYVEKLIRERRSAVGKELFGGGRHKAPGVAGVLRIYGDGRQEIFKAGRKPAAAEPDRPGPAQPTTQMLRARAFLTSLAETLPNSRWRRAASRRPTTMVSQHCSSASS
jgi:acyl-CoA thioesterase-1